MRPSFVFVTIVFCVQISTSYCRSTGPLVLEDVLPAKYDKMEPPKQNDEATKVKFHITIINMDTFDESSMTYKCDIFLAQSWKDYRLLLPADVSENGTYRQLPVKWLEDIWKPDTYFKNSKKVSFSEKTVPNHYIWLWHDNTILYMSKYSLEMTCPMTFEKYPHDRQSCIMNLESLSYTMDDLVFVWDEDHPLNIDSSIEMPELWLYNTTNAACVTLYPTGNFSCLEVQFNLKRRLGRFLLQTYIPTILIVLVSWLSFWMQPENVTERIMLGVTSLLTIFAQHAISLQSLPPVSYLKAIDVFMNLCTMFVFLSIVEFVIISKILSRYDHPDYSSISPSYQSQVEDKDNENGKPPRLGILVVPKTKEDGWKLATKIDRISRVVIPALFVILNAIYWGIYEEFA